MKTLVEITPSTGEFAEDKDYARELRLSVILPELERSGTIVLDFKNVKYVTQSFVHALVGEALKRFGAEVLEKIDFKNCSPQVRAVVALVVDYSLGGFSNGDQNLVEAEPFVSGRSRARR